MTNAVNRPMDLSTFSFTEAGYLINDAITESCNDLIVRVKEANNRSLQENGYSYFAEADNDSKGVAYVFRRIKEIVKKAVDAVLGMFQKVIDFFKDVARNITLLGIKKLSDADKQDFVLYSKDTKAYNEVLSKAVKKCFDVGTGRETSKVMAMADKELASRGAISSVPTVKDVLEAFSVKDEASIRAIFTPKYIIDNVFGGFRDVAKEIIDWKNKSVKDIKNAEKAAEAAAKVDKNDNLEETINNLKVSLKVVNIYTTAYCKAVVTQSKIAAHFAKAVIEKGSSGKDLDSGFDSRVGNKASKYADKIDRMTDKDRKGFSFPW